MSSSSSSSSSVDINDEYYKEQKNIAMQMAAMNALEKQNKKGTTAVSPSETQLIQAANKGNFEEVVRITRSELMSKIEANSEQIEILKKQMKKFTEVAETLEYIDQIRKKLDSFSDRFKRDNEHWTDLKKQMIQGQENTNKRLEKIRDDGISVTNRLITDDTENLKNIDFILSGYDKIISTNEEVIEYIEHFKKNDLKKKHLEILSKEDDSWMEDTSPSPSKTKKNPKKKKGGSKKRTKKKKTKKRKTKRKNHK